jgi:hypothetical protein
MSRPDHYPNILGNIRNRCLVCALALLFPASLYAQTADLFESTDFAKISRNGFKYRVNGSIFADAVNKTGFPNLVIPPSGGGGPENSYAWSMSWFNDQLYVGTNRMVQCSSAYNRGGDPACDASMVAGPTIGGQTVYLPGPLWRAEIWRYTPGDGPQGDDVGLSGTWTRFYQSPYWELPFPYDILFPNNVPRDMGYRMMTQCDAGDGTNRLYIATHGLPGNILYYAGSNNPVTKTNNAGTYTTDAALEDYYLNGEPFDLGYRALTCFKRRLWTSPAGTLGDPDASAHPVILMNANPAGGAAWTEVLDVSDPASSPLSNSNNAGIFQTEAIGDYLFLSVGNRLTGFELWRGDGTSCNNDGSNPCTLVWEKLIANGAGRPLAEAGRTTPENAGATLGVYGNDLYMGVGESGYAEEGLTSAELLRIKDAHTGNKQWEVLVGWPRKDYASPSALASWSANFLCVDHDLQDAVPNPGDLPADAIVGSVNSGRFTFVTGFLDDPEDADLDDCFPASGFGPGMGTLTDTDLTPSPYRFGSEGYFWRMQEHEGTFFLGTLGRGSLWRTDDGLDFSRIFTNGFDNQNNIGLRTMASTPWGLAVGTTNAAYDAVDTEGNPVGGMEVLLGSSLMQSRDFPIPPIAIATVDTNPNYDNNGDGKVDHFDVAQSNGSIAGDGLVTVTLRDGGSFAPFAKEGGISRYEWYEGPVEDCATATTPVCDTSTPVDCVLTDVSSMGGGNDFMQHTYTLRVTSLEGIGCDAVTITASSNLPPQAQVTPSVPFGNNTRVNLIDFNNDTYEYYDVLGMCTDPDNDQIIKCEWQLEQAGNSLQNSVSCGLPKTGECDITATVRALRSDLASALVNGSSSPNISLYVEDANGYNSLFRFDNFVQSAATNADTATNVAPVCRNASLQAESGVTLVIDPTVNLADGYPICLERDTEDAIASYNLRNPTPTNGIRAVVAGPPPGVSYASNAGFTGVDKFGFRANDGTTNSSDAAIQVTVLPLTPSICQVAALTINPTAFAGTLTRSSQTSITTAGTVVVSAAADVTFKAPVITLGPGFKVTAGGKFLAQNEAVVCP